MKLDDKQTDYWYLKLQNDPNVKQNFPKMSKLSYTERRSYVYENFSINGLHFLELIIPLLRGKVLIRDGIEIHNLESGEVEIALWVLHYFDNLLTNFEERLKKEGCPKILSRGWLYYHKGLCYQVMGIGEEVVDNMRRSINEDIIAYGTTHHAKNWLNGICTDLENILSSKVTNFDSQFKGDLEFIKNYDMDLSLMLIGISYGNLYSTNYTEITKFRAESNFRLFFTICESIAKLIIQTYLPSFQFVTIGSLAKNNLETNSVISYGGNPGPSHTFPDLYTSNPTINEQFDSIEAYISKIPVNFVPLYCYKLFKNTRNLYLHNILLNREFTISQSNIIIRCVWDYLYWLHDSLK